MARVGVAPAANSRSQKDASGCDSRSRRLTTPLARSCSCTAASGHTRRTRCRVSILAPSIATTRSVHWESADKKRSSAAVLLVTKTLAQPSELVEAAGVVLVEGAWYRSRRGGRIGRARAVAVAARSTTRANAVGALRVSSGSVGAGGSKWCVRRCRKRGTAPAVAYGASARSDGGASAGVGVGGASAGVGVGGAKRCGRCGRGCALRCARLATAFRRRHRRAATVATAAASSASAASAGLAICHSSMSRVGLHDGRAGGEEG